MVGQRAWEEGLIEHISKLRLEKSIGFLSMILIYSFKMLLT